MKIGLAVTSEYMTPSGELIEDIIVIFPETLDGISAAAFERNRLNELHGFTTKIKRLEIDSKAKEKHYELEKGNVK